MENFDIRRTAGNPRFAFSYSTDDSWDLWQPLRIQKTTVQRYIEPVLAFLVGLSIYALDPFLGFWLISSAVALFVKEQVTRFKTARRILDASDARLQAQHLNTGLNNYVLRPSQGVQRSHRARPASTPPPGRP